MANTIGIVIGILALTGVAALVVYGGRVLVATANADDPTHAPGAHVLRYHVAVGQEPVALVGAVREAGYHATTEAEGGRVDLLVMCEGDPAVERERVRAAIAGAPDRQGIHGDLRIPPVQFVDEVS